ncbi:MAG: inositol monophosphatase [Puniceicoccales bacterium]
MTPRTSVLSEEDWRRIARLLFDLGVSIRDGICASRSRGHLANAASIHHTTAADTIYHIDHISEKVLLEWFEENWPDDYPADIIAEGLGDETGERFPRGATENILTILIDPIDGTRGLMYDKRSAWMLAGAAEAGNHPTPNDLKAGAMVEIPTSRQGVTESVCAWQTDEGPFHSEAIRTPGPSGRPEPFPLRASTATDLRHGFASFAAYFPEGRDAIQRIESTFLQKHLPEMPSETPLVFTDQYISSGGQLFELLAGRDRLVADLRPLVFNRYGPKNALTCHPYDLACLPVAQASGCIIEDPWGAPLTPPLDTTSPVSWVGYANKTLARNLRPLLQETLQELGYPTP